MANLVEVKNKFKQAYSVQSWEFVEEHEDELFFQHSGAGVKFKVSSEDIQSYLNFEKNKNTYINKPFQTCLCGKSHYEQMISFNEPYGRSLLRRGRSISFQNENNSTIVEISNPTQDYKNYVRFEKYFLIRTLRSLHFNLDGDEGETKAIGDFLYLPSTIKVFNISYSNPQEMLNQSLDIVEGCLFHLAYLKDISSILEEDFPRHQVRRDNFRFEDRDFGSELPLPRLVINKDVARFYQRGVAAEDPVIQFLSYYQVLEYYFLMVNDEELYNQLKALYSNPSFKPTPKYLDRIIQSTLDHKRESNETTMLTRVINKYVPKNELIEFINKYEEHLREKIYSKERKLFGENTKISLSAGHVTGDVAKRVKLIRNTLVHSSDRYNRKNENYIPSRENENIIRQEVSLVKFMAEKVIVSTMS
jgi:hypothetical protein